MIQRLELSAHVKAVAGALAAFCEGDGSNVVTTDAAVYHGLGIGERQLRNHVSVLQNLKLLHVVKHGGGRGRARKHGGANRRELNQNAIVCQLTAPVDGDLPWLLDAHFLPIGQRQKGEAPVKAIAASRAARTNNTGSGTTTVSGTGAGKHRQPDYRSNPETPVEPLPEDAENSGSTATGESTAEPGNSGSWATGESWEELANAGNPATTESGAPVENSGSTPTADSPVDNPAAPIDDAAAGLPQFPGNSGSPAAKTPVAAAPNSGSPATAPVFKTLENLENLTPLVVSLGGDLTSAAEPEPTPIDSEFPGPDPVDEHGLAQLAASVPLVPPPDLEYDRARSILAELEPAELQERLSDAQGELEAEAAAAAAGYDDGMRVTADSRQIMLRAAQIVLRAGPAEAGR